MTKDKITIKELFSKKQDGTTFLEDLKQIIQNLKEDWAAERLETLLDRIKQLEALYEGRGDWILAFGEKIRQDLNNPIATQAMDFVAAIIPGEADDAFMKWLREQGVDRMLDLYYGTGTFIGQVEDKLQAWINSLRGVTEDRQDAEVAKTMSILLREYTQHENKIYGTPALSARASDTFIQLGVELMVV